MVLLEELLDYVVEDDVPQLLFCVLFSFYLVKYVSGLRF